MIEDAIADGDIVLSSGERPPGAARPWWPSSPARRPSSASTARRGGSGSSLNSTMEPIYADEVEIRGVVCGVVRRY